MKQEPFLSRSPLLRAFPLLNRLGVDTEETCFKGMVPIVLAVLLLHLVILIVLSYCLHVPKQTLPLFSSVQVAFEETPHPSPVPSPELDTDLAKVEPVKEIALPDDALQSLPVPEPVIRKLAETVRVEKKPVSKEKTGGRVSSLPASIQSGRADPSPAPSPAPVAQGRAVPVQKKQGSMNSEKRNWNFVANYCSSPEEIYPLAARRRHEQGKAVLSLRVLKNGQVSQVRITDSTGFEDLDRAAVLAVNHIRCQAGMMEGDFMDTTTIVSFTLHET